MSPFPMKPLGPPSPSLGAKPPLPPMGAPMGGPPPLAPKVKKPPFLGKETPGEEAREPVRVGKKRSFVRSAGKRFGGRR